jgi:CubicO group peptidase (beta-lactamase class C family)
VQNRTTNRTSQDDFSVDLSQASTELRGSVGRILAQPPELDLTLALLVVRNDVIMAEGYGPASGVDRTLISWSMAKSVTHALIGLLIHDGLLDVNESAPIAAWQNDDRRHITIQHLLNMSSGLKFVEDYVDDSISDCIEMLFGSGKHDVASYAAALPLLHEPGTVWNYSSGTTNLLTRIAGDRLGGGQSGMETFLQDRLFAPLGMTSATPKFDDAGTFIGSSFLYATARDFAKFGLLYLNDGAVNGQQILPLGWVGHARTPIPVPESESYGYGAHWWIWPSHDAFGCHGYEGQRIVVVPGHNAVIVRLGKTRESNNPYLNAAIKELMDSL